MFRQNPYNPCQLLQEMPESSGNWVVVFDLALCNPSYIGISSGINDEQKRCNIASLLIEITLPDGVEPILTAREANQGTQAFASTITSILASLFALGGTIPAVLLLSVAGAEALASRYPLLDPSAARAQIDNAYWLDIKRQLFCSMPNNGILTPQALQIMADSVFDIPDKDQANEVISGILRGLSDDAAKYVSSFGARYNGDINGCDDCASSNCELFGTTSESQAIFLGDNHWKLKVETGSFYFGWYRISYGNRCCRIKIDNIVTSPSNTAVPVLSISRCGENNEELFNTVESLDDQCVSWFNIRSLVPFEIDVSLTDNCGNTSICQLYAEVVEGYFEALPAGPNGDFVLNSTDRLPLPETGGYRRYFLSNTSSCCQIQKLQFAGGLNGQLPAKVKVYDCDGNETEYTNINDINAFFAGEICFNSFALAPVTDSFYLLKVSLSSCEEDACENYADDLQSALGAKTYIGGGGGTDLSFAHLIPPGSHGSYESSNGRTGGGCLVSGTHSGGYNRVTAVVDMGQDCAIVGISFYTHKDPGGASSRYILVYDAAGNQVYSEGSPFGSTGWQSYNHSFPTPAAGRYVVLLWDTNPAGGVCRIDDIFIEAA